MIWRPTPDAALPTRHALVLFMRVPVAPSNKGSGVGNAAMSAERAGFPASASDHMHKADATAPRHRR
eukprot:6352107-Karenia_brevis.AAC.1